MTDMEKHGENKESAVQQPYSHKVLVSYHDSLVNLAKRGVVASWKVPNEKIFLAHMGEDEKDIIHRQNLLESAVVGGVTIEKIHSTFPCNMSINIPAVPKKLYSLNTGHPSDYVAFPNETCTKLDAVVMEPLQTWDSSYLNDHANYMPSRFTEGVLRPNNAPYSYVPIDHPIIKMINTFPKDFQLKLTPRDMVDSKYYKVNNELLEKAESLMLPKIESMFPQSNLKEFTVNLSRADGLPFDDPAGILDNVGSPEAQFKIMNAKRKLDLVLNIDFSFIPLDEACI